MFYRQTVGAAKARFPVVVKVTGCNNAACNLQAKIETYCSLPRVPSHGARCCRKTDDLDKGGALAMRVIVTPQSGKALFN